MGNNSVSTPVISPPKMCRKRQLTTHSIRTSTEVLFLTNHKLFWLILIAAVLPFLFAGETTLITRALAAYVCPTISPTSGQGGYFGVDATVTLNYRCEFKDDNTGTTYFATDLASMATAASRTIGKTARVNMIGAQFSSGASIVIYGYTDPVTFAPLEDVPAALSNIGFKFLMQDCYLTHISPRLIAVEFYGLFPPKTNITLSGNLMQGRITSKAVPQTTQDMEELLTMLIFTFSKLYDNSIIIIADNQMYFVLQVIQQIPFDEAEYRAIVEDRQESQNPSQPTLYQKAISFIYFGTFVQVADSSRIQVSGNYFYCDGNITVTDAEIGVITHAFIMFEGGAEITKNSKIDIFLNGGQNTVNYAFQNMHGVDRMLSAFLLVAFSMFVRDQSSMSITQNYWVFKSNQSSHGSDLYDPSLEQGHSLYSYFIAFVLTVSLNSSCSIVVALNVLQLDLIAKATPERSPIFTSCITAFIHHGSFFSATYNSHYLVHGNIYFAHARTVLNDKSSFTFNFIRLEMGLGISESSRAIFGCVNPFPSPDSSLNYRVNHPTYSDLYEQFNPKKAKEWNGPYMNRSSFDYIQKHFGNEGTTLTDRSLLGKGINDKCYANSARMTSFQEKKSSSISNINFILLFGLNLMALNGSVIGIVNNIATMTAHSAFDDSLIVFVFGYFLGDPSIPNQLYNGQIIIAANLASVASSKLNIEDGFVPDGVVYEVTEEELIALQKFDRPSCFAISNNDVQKEYPNVMTGPHFMNTLYSKYGMWIKDASKLLITNNTVSLLARPPAVTHSDITSGPYASLFDISSPDYDPFFDFKNTSVGAFTFLIMEDTYIANPNGSISITGNFVAFFDGTTYTPSGDVNLNLNLIPFSGYEGISSGQFDKSYFGYSREQIEEAEANAPQIDGKPILFIMRPGPPIIHLLDWTTNFTPDVWHGGGVTRYPIPSSPIALFKDETPPVNTTGDVVPWSNDLRIDYCGNKLNKINVESAELQHIFKSLVNAKGLSLNKDSGTAATEGVGLEVYGCSVDVKTDSLSLTISQSLSDPATPLSLSWSSSYTKSLSLIHSPTSTKTLSGSKSAIISSSASPTTILGVKPASTTEDTAVKTAREVTSSALGGVVNTVGAALGGSSLGQITISNAVLRMSACVSRLDQNKDTDEDGDGDSTNDDEDDLPIMVHPLRFSIDKSAPFHQERGAIVGNAIVAGLSVAFLRFVAVYVAGKLINANEDSRLIVGWPSAFTLPFVALVEGTTTCATRLLNDLVVDNDPEEDIGSSNKTEVSQNPSSLKDIPMSVRGLNYFLGFATFAFFAVISAWWAYCIIAGMPNRYLERKRQNHKAWGLWLLEPRYEWQYHVSEEERKRMNESKGDYSVLVGGATGGLVQCETTSVPAATLHEMTDNGNVMEASFISLKLHQSFGSSNVSALPAKEDEVSAAPSSEECNIPGTAPPKDKISRVQAQPPTEIEVTTTLQRLSHLYGDKYFLWIELLCFLSAIAVGVSEGMADTRCRTKITVASVAAIAQVIFNLSSTIPVELIVQSLLGLCTAALTTIALVRVYSKKIVDQELEDGMELVGFLGNILGLIAIAIALFAVAHRLFRARKIARRVELRRLRDHFASTANRKYEEIAKEGTLGNSNKASICGIDNDPLTTQDDQYGKKKAQKKKVISTANQAFEIKIDLGDDLDLFLLDVEEAAAKINDNVAEVDELDIEMAVVGVGEDLSLVKGRQQMLGQTTPHKGNNAMLNVSFNNISFVGAQTNNLSFGLAMSNDTANDASPLNHSLQTEGIVDASTTVAASRAGKIRTVVRKKSFPNSVPRRDISDL